MDKIVLEAYEIAKESRNNAHAPYSKFLVGSAIKFKHTSQIFGGCNVENASYGGTICAERSAILSSISKKGAGELEFVVVCVDTDPLTVPCAFCLQVMSEFAKPDMPVYMGDLEGIKKTVTFKELLPMPFNTLEC